MGMILPSSYVFSEQCCDCSSETHPKQANRHSSKERDHSAVATYFQETRKCNDAQSSVSSKLEKRAWAIFHTKLQSMPLIGKTIAGTRCRNSSHVNIYHQGTVCC